MLSDDDKDIEIIEIVEAVDTSDVIVTSDEIATLAGTVREDHTQAVVAMSGDARMVNALRALPLRGWGVVPPDAMSDELRAAVHAASLGLVVLPANMLPAAERDSRAESVELDKLEQPLTPREVEVLELVSRGLPSKLIARELDVSESTVKFHLSSIYTKLNASSRTEAVSRAARMGLITL